MFTYGCWFFGGRRRWVACALPSRTRHTWTPYLDLLARAASSSSNRTLRLIPFYGIKLQIRHFKIFTFFVIPFYGIKQHARHAETLTTHLNGQYSFATMQNNISTGVPSRSQNLVIRDCLGATISVAIVGPLCVLLTKIHAFWQWLSRSCYLLANIWSRKTISDFSSVSKGTVRYFSIISTRKN